MMQRFPCGWGQCFDSVKCVREADEYAVCEGMKPDDWEARLTFESTVSMECEDESQAAKKSQGGLWEAVDEAGQHSSIHVPWKQMAWV